MDWKTVLQSPFFTVALPIVVTLIVSIVVQNKRIDDLKDAMNRQFDGVNRQFDGVNRQFDGVNRQFDGVDRRFEGVNRQFEGINQRLDRIESKLDSHAERIAKLEGPALVRGS